MKIFRVVILCSLFVLTSCGVRKNTVAPQESAEKRKIEYAQLPEFDELKEEITEDLEEDTFDIISHALQFLGTSYKYGGTTPDGMDCSGLVYTSFLQQNIELPRSSKDMALLGEQLDLERVRTGDLLFFETDRRKRIINHVGLVVELEGEKIYFIHSSTSRGVIISALDENYWREHFVMARRIL